MKRVEEYLRSTKEQAILICLVIWGQVVVVEYSNLEDSVIGTNTQIGYGYT